MPHVDRVVFNGVSFRRYPDSPNVSERSYFTPSGNERKRGVGRLHQEIWKSVHGPIPPGCHVHHDDGNTLNNEPGNLVCLTEAEHVAVHAEDARGSIPLWFVASRSVALAKAAEWHRSEEGRAWHREHGRRTWEKRQPTARTCDQCGASYDTLSRHGSERFCSNNCKSAWRRASGVDDIDKSCEWCGTAFTSNRYLRTRCCSRSCAGKLRRRS